MTKNKIKNYLYIIIWPIMFIIGQIAIRLLFALIFYLNNSKKYSDDIYFDKLSNYINSSTLLITFLTALIFIPIYYLIYKKYRTKKHVKSNLKYIFIALLLGITVSFIYNILIYNLNNVIHFTNAFNKNNIPVYIQIISSGLVGPIIEELIFRGIVYNKLKEFNKPMKSIIICSVFFGIVHFNIMEIIYAFGVSFLLIYLYEKTKSLVYPIVMHIFLNISAIIFVNCICLENMCLNITLIIICSLILLLLRKIINKDR